MEISNNPIKQEVFTKQYLRSILDISVQEDSRVHMTFLSNKEGPEKGVGVGGEGINPIPQLSLPKSQPQSHVLDSQSSVPNLVFPVKKGKSLFQFYPFRFPLKFLNHFIRHTN